VAWLVAEDEADIRVLITTMIRVWGHQSAAFENGQKVWDWLDKLEAGDPEAQPPELVLMDIRMPGKKGNELSARMRELPALKHTPLVLMTAFSMTEAERAELLTRDGADAVINKPLPEFEQLRKLLHDLVDAKQAAAPADEAPALEAPAPAAAAPEAPKPPVTPETPVEPAPAIEKASVPKSL